MFINNKNLLLYQLNVLYFLYLSVNFNLINLYPYFMFVINDLFAFKPLTKHKTYEDYLEVENVEYDDDYYLNLLKTTTDAKFYEYGMYFVYKYYLNKLEKNCINKKIECINVVRDAFLKNPKWYTYDILKYLTLDLDFYELKEMFNDHPLLSMIIGEHLLRTEQYSIEDISCLKFPFYISLPFYFYKKKFNLSIFDIKMVFLFTDLIFTENFDYRMQYYIINWKEVINVGEYAIKIVKLETVNFKFSNPFTNFLLFKQGLLCNPVENVELMILFYDDPSHIVEGSVYTEIIKRHHKISYKNCYENINYYIYDDIIRKYCLVDYKYKESFSYICKDYALNLHLNSVEVLQIEFIFNLEEIFFNTFITNNINYKFTWNNVEIDTEIIFLIKEYHTKKLMSKKYRDNLFNKILENKYKEIFLLYLINRNNALEYINEENFACICKIKRREWLLDYNNIKKIIGSNKDVLSLGINCTCKDELYLKYIKICSDYENDARYQSILLKYKKFADISENKVVCHTQSNKQNITLPPVVKRYKLNIKKSTQIDCIKNENNEHKATFFLTRYMSSCTYKKFVKKHLIYYDYINIKYKTTNYKFIKYLKDEVAKEHISDLIKYDIKRLAKLTKLGCKLEEYQFFELQERLKKEGRKGVIKLIGKILSYNSNYKIDILTYEDLDFYGKNMLLDHLIYCNRISYNKSDFIKSLLILNNEDNVNLVLKILEFIKSNLNEFYKYKEILERYKKNDKFNKLMIRILPLWGYDTDYYQKICASYKFKEELEIYEKFYKN